MTVMAPVMMASMMVMTNGKRISHRMGMMTMMMTMVIVMVNRCCSCQMMMVMVSVGTGFHSDHGNGSS